MNQQREALWETYSGTQASGTFQLMSGLLHEDQHGMRVLGDILASGSPKPATANSYFQQMKQLSAAFNSFFKLYLNEVKKDSTTHLQATITSLTKQLAAKTADAELYRKKYDELLGVVNLKREIKQLRLENTALKKKKKPQ